MQFAAVSTRMLRDYGRWYIQPGIRREGLQEKTSLFRYGLLYEGAEESLV